MAARSGKFDVKTKQYQEYKIPLPATAPKNSVEHWDQVPGEESRMVAEGTFYDIQWIRRIRFG